MKGKSSCEFRRWRLSLGYTQREAAKVLGYSRPVLQLYDQGKQEPPLVMLLAMAALFKGLRPYYEDTAQRRQLEAATRAQRGRQPVANYRV